MLLVDFSSPRFCDEADVADIPDDRLQTEATDPPSQRQIFGRIHRPLPQRRVQTAKNEYIFKICI